MGLYQEESYHQRYLFTKETLTDNMAKSVFQTFSLPSYEWSSSPSYPQTLTPFLSSRFYTSFNYLAVVKSQIFMGLLVVPMGKNLSVMQEMVRDLGSIPESGRSPGGENGKLLQYFCLENPKDGGAWQAQFIGSKRVEAT